MVCNGIYVAETFEVNPMDALNETHWITMEKSGEAPVFYVYACCDDDWFYVFKMSSNTDYERVKHNIIDMIFECDTMDELLANLGKLFKDGFADILINKEEINN